MNKKFPPSKKYTSPSEMICLLKKHIWSPATKDMWMGHHGDPNFYYHKCNRCAQEVKHLAVNCPSCYGSTYCEGDDEPEHTCPFDVKFRKDSTSLCTCCRNCTKECSTNI